ncbi:MULTISPECIES: trehalose operon repressor [Bacillota]|uniref:Trehalose operon repressor n=2 Tax=Amedibacillus TaxID=2749846 RepID=A0A7G9GSL1_9FIRM|nr:MULTISPECIES: trehalose operon repressor [Bacillota]MCH4283820.1 trehalose operon repressor [Amedibacillus hominis]QNM13793.1 trehalose operon repressor [[Eubacterium] hominis]
MKPKHQILYEKILKKIQDRAWPDDKLPSEKELMAIYDVSRDTVRKALQHLSEDGFIIRAQGKATTVLRNKDFEFPVMTLDSFIEQHEKDSQTDIKLLEKIQAGNDIAECLQIHPNEEIYHLIRVRSINGKRMILDEDYFPISLIPDLTKEDAQRSVYDYIEQKLNLSIGFASRKLSAAKADARDYEMLDLDDYNTVIVLTSYGYLQDGRLFQYNESHHHPEEFEYMDIAKRR